MLCSQAVPQRTLMPRSFYTLITLVMKKIVIPGYSCTSLQLPQPHRIWRNLTVVRTRMHTAAGDMSLAERKCDTFPPQSRDHKLTFVQSDYSTLSLS